MGTRLTRMVARGSRVRFRRRPDLWLYLVAPGGRERIEQALRLEHRWQPRLLGARQLGLGVDFPAQSLCRYTLRGRNAVQRGTIEALLQPALQGPGLARFDDGGLEARWDEVSTGSAG
jgi:hypothetical protein